MFVAHNKVRMHDTDMAGILYFARQFRFAHDALEDFADANGLGFHQLFHKEEFIFVIVHVEGDYYKSLNVGDPIETHLWVEAMGTSSFTLAYTFFRHQEKVGAAKTVHVTLDRQSRQKIAIPLKLRSILDQNLANPSL